MLTAPPATDAAFCQLITALDAEIAELRRTGSLHFHADGAPRESQGLLRRAHDRTRLREEVARLYHDWQQVTAGPAAPVAVDEPVDPEAPNPVLIRHIKGMSVSDAATRLRVSEAKVREWLESGTLKGYRPTGGRWKIVPADLIAFTRDHRDLI